MENFNQHFIDSLGEKNIENNYFQGKKQTLDFSDKLFRNTRSNYVLQHYLTKCIEKGLHPASRYHYLDQFYKDFYKRPWKYVNSPLLKDVVIKKVYGDKADGIISFRNKYYSIKTARYLYIKSRTTPLTIEEKNQLYSFFTRNLDTTNKNIQESMKREIKKIIDSNKESKDFSSAELQFYCQYMANTTKTRPTIIIGEDRETLNGSENHNLICINNKSKDKKVDSIARIVFHECRHAHQEEEAKNNDTDEAYEMATNLLLQQYMNTENYDCYDSNYRFSSIELDAEDVGYYQGRWFLKDFGRNDLYEKLKKERDKKVTKRNYYPIMIDEKRNHHSVDRFLVENIDKIIKSHPEELEKYPILKHFYYDNGEKKSFFTILKQRVNQVSTRKAYEHYIDYGIKQGELDKINLNELDKQTIASIMPALISIYRHEKVCIIKDYLIDTETYSTSNNKENTKKRIELSTNYELVLATKMLSFVNKNFDILYPLTDGFSDFLYDFKGYKESNLKNPALKDSILFNTKLRGYLSVYNDVLKKYNMINKKRNQHELNTMLNDTNDNMKDDNQNSYRH